MRVHQFLLLKDGSSRPLTGAQDDENEIGRHAELAKQAWNPSSLPLKSEVSKGKMDPTSRKRAPQDDETLS